MSKKILCFITILFLFICAFGCSSCKDKYYEITFDSAGGTPVESINVKKGEKIEAPAEPYKEDFCFAGWYYNDRPFSFEKTIVKKNIKLTAKWFIPFAYSVDEDKISLDFFTEFESRTELITPKHIDGKPVYKIGESCFATSENIKPKSFLKKIVVSEGVEVIDDFAFYGCSAVEEIVLPESLKSFGNGCFANCPNLKKINIPSKITEIPTNAFSWDEMLENVEIPNGVMSIGSAAFMNCKHLTIVNIPSTVNFLGNEVFLNCQMLGVVTLSANLKSISKYCFSGCTSLAKITIPSGVELIVEGAFMDCPSLTYCYIPATVSVIGKNVFKNSTKCSIHCEAQKNEVNFIMDWNCNCKVYWNEK